MSLLEVLQLVGYSVGAALPLWLGVLLARQRHSLARTEPGLPILKATFVKGKMTTSRIGTIGSRRMSAGVRSEYSSITQDGCFLKRP